MRNEKQYQQGKKWRENNVERMRELRRRWKKRWPDKQRASKRRWKNNNRLKIKAHDAVRWAIHSGNLKKMPCSICDNKIVEAHHPDYSKPLSVIWLCQFHHQEIHKKTSAL